MNFIKKLWYKILGRKENDGYYGEVTLKITTHLFTKKDPLIINSMSKFTDDKLLLFKHKARFKTKEELNEMLFSSTLSEDYMDVILRELKDREERVYRKLFVPQEGIDVKQIVEDNRIE